MLVRDMVILRLGTVDENDAAALLGGIIVVRTVIRSHSGLHRGLGFSGRAQARYAGVSITRP